MNDQRRVWTYATGGGGFLNMLKVIGNYQLNAESDSIELDMLNNEDIESCDAKYRGLLDLAEYLDVDQDLRTKLNLALLKNTEEPEADKLLNLKRAVTAALDSLCDSLPVPDDVDDMDIHGQSNTGS
eukprot:CAMPEP_0114335038 /NCGR_PEP_ID=MMETSP0101-20121206/4794_1 /TAXON_ID=38822 ORGANISM="Pteridomonas danica, Strain PT" /NCGR_SAMPLE_ID=MMETSP0101 /ASSEMBLY_ACC=CAM_ASM_000211 /LENGTH=126 /DNA_ID=CAMNT_0001466535 /DNA_START=525 /DNA_END=906 /DNA_ORIENTATION=+